MPADWQDDLAAVAHGVLRPGWSCVVTLKADGEARAVPERVYRRRGDAFRQQTRLLNSSDAETLTPNYYVAQMFSDGKVAVWCGKDVLLCVSEADDAR